jgi:CheY-specific phosphatase CheX
VSPDLVERIDAIVQAAARSLFESYGLRLGDAPEAHGPPRDHDLSAAIGFTAPEVHGAIVMTTRKDIVARAWPEELRHCAPREHDVCDWAGELLNQLLGRAKNALAAFGLVLDQATPTVVTGWQLHRVPASTHVARRYAFTAAGGLVFIYFDAVLADGFALGESDDKLRSAAEGELRLF